MAVRLTCTNSAVIDRLTVGHVKPLEATAQSSDQSKTDQRQTQCPKEIALVIRVASPMTECIFVEGNIVDRSLEAKPGLVESTSSPGFSWLVCRDGVLIRERVL
jgi:hypothetical protein